MDLSILINAGRPIGPSDIRILARSAAAEMAHTDSYEACRGLGQRALQAIAENAPDKADRAYATVVAGATQKLSARSAYECQERALMVLSQGVCGPVSVALASLASESVRVCNSHTESRDLGCRILEGVTNNTEDVREMVLAKTGVSAAGTARDAGSGLHAVNTALNQLEAGLRHPLERTLADYGRGALKVSDDKDARSISQAVLKSVLDNSDRPEVQFIANSALAATSGCASPGDAVGVARRAFKDIRKL